MNTISKCLLFVVCGATVGLTAPLSAQSAKASSTRTAAPTAHRAPTRAGERGDRRTVYYITGVTATGSHIPVVVERYQGHNNYLNSGVRIGSGYGSGYNSDDIGVTGALNVGDALRTLDPAISSIGAGNVR